MFTNEIICHSGDLTKCTDNHYDKNKDTFIIFVCDLSFANAYNDKIWPIKSFWLQSALQML